MDSVSGEGKHGSSLGVGINSDNTSVKGCMSKPEAAVPDCRADRIIMEDPTALTLNSAFQGVYPRLVPILQRDNVREFLCFCKNNMWAMAWDFIIPQALLHMIIHNSLRCAKVALEGQAPELEGFRAYPNCATQYGFFPLHEAAEIFSVDMTKLLLQYGASANIRTSGSRVIEGLLPINVAVENTCMHKYLDDNLFPNELCPNYCKADTNDIYKLIHLLCLPEMIFLDTTRLLAENTNDLISEICNYIKHGKIVHTAVLLLVAQGHIRGSCSCKRNGNVKPDGFSYIIRYIAEHNNDIKLERVHNKKEYQKLKEKYISSTLWLVEAISVAGRSLSEYIQGYSKEPAPHEEVIERVSSILKFYGFCPTGEGISIESLKLSPYKLPLPIVNETKKRRGKASKVAAGERVAVGKELPRSWDLVCKRRKFFPFWRSALSWGLGGMICPPHALDDKYLRDVKAICQMSRVSSPTPDHNISLSASMPQPTSNHRSQRLFGTAASTSNYQSQRLFGTAPSTSNYQSKRLFGAAALMLLKALNKV
ncbi:uncharacterized protein LOC102707437 isoform X4 [Oryza brachyantha]|uniref:uncharacterized protein LOC102707437 isoform X4 n=1 Tax=Oryza brachyantha TaxID=4533 RepID=UPI00077644CA|nr:uncharacterized protein LOC102707437 isoform X4 [Oryza brachyantha]